MLFLQNYVGVAMNKESTYSGLVAAIGQLINQGQSIGFHPAFPEMPDSSMIVVIGDDHFHLDDPEDKRQITSAINWINAKLGVGKC